MSNYIYHGNWAKVSICTPKGKRVEEHYEAWGYDGYQDSQEDQCLDEYNYDYTDHKSDRRLRYCHCGWSKWTTYQDLRTHQGKWGCTPKGVKVKEHEQQYYGSGDGGYQDSQEDQHLDDYNYDYTDNNSDRRLRNCHCGWSKVTTYQGLRTHQGKQGCTPKGVKVKEHDQQYYGRGGGGYQDSQEDQYLDEYNSDYIHYNSGRRLRDCHCGWSKVTTYQGLRIHQGKMGCTPKGIRIPESEQPYWKSQWERSYQPAVRIEECDQYCNPNSDRRLRYCHCGWSKLTTYQDLRTHQGKTGCTPKGIKIPESEQPYWKSQWEMRQGYYQPAKSMAVRRSGCYMREI